MKSAFMFIGIFLMVPLLASGSVVINEIAWMGTANSVNDEWIELYNNGASSVNLDGWKLMAQDGTPDITLTGTIVAGGFFLLERTDDTTVPNVSADQIYTGALGNNGEVLFLKNSSSVIVDQIDAGSGWPAGDKTTKETMQRTSSGWITAQATPRASNAGDSQPTTIESSESSSSSVVATSEPTVVANAGGDRSGVVSEEIVFKGTAVTLKGEPERDVRFLWDFGDGAMAEGKEVVHLYIQPGTYFVSLNATLKNYTHSDRVRVVISVSVPEVPEVKPQYVEASPQEEPPLVAKKIVQKSTAAQILAISESNQGTTAPHTIENALPDSARSYPWFWWLVVAVAIAILGSVGFILLR